MKCHSANPKTQNLLIIEPEMLTRWSLVTYLGRWFAVQAADSCESAQVALKGQRVDGVVLSTEFPPWAVQAIERLARKTNPAVRVVRTITQQSQGVDLARGTLMLEKPFKLRDLARLLGVEPENEGA